MRLMGKDKELNKKWRPILRGWLKELPPMNTDFALELISRREIIPGARGQFKISTATITLPIGSNDIEEIKHCFFHEVQHWLQLLKNTLPISTYTSRYCGNWEKEKEACGFALKYAPCRSGYILTVLAIYGIKKEEK